MKEKKMDIIPAEHAKLWTLEAGLTITVVRDKLNDLIEQAARQGNTVIFMILPKYIALEDIHALSAELHEIGYQVRFGLEESYYYFNIHCH